jgi:predicted dienelactone hydrolase
MAAACGAGSTDSAAPPDGHGSQGSVRDSGTGGKATGADAAGFAGGSGDASVTEGDAGPDASSDDASSQVAADALADDASIEASTNGADVEAGSCAMAFPAVSDFGSAGPFEVAIDCSVPTSVTTDGTGCAVYHPTTMGQNGRKHPVIVWGNGTAAPPECNGTAHEFGEYDYLLNQWASEGFIVVAANTDSTGNGGDMLDCLDWLEQQNSTAGSTYEGVVDVGNYGASGHSQGGASALNVGEDPRIVATLPFMPYTVGGGFSYDPAAPTKQHGPIFLASGGMDTIATPSTNQQPVFDASTAPTFWGTLLSADHVTFAGGSQTDWLAPSTAWFRLQLMCDQSARPMFYGPDCTLCADSKWTVQRKNM